MTKPPSWIGEPPDFPMLATAVVPWTEKYEFDEQAFRREVQVIASKLTRHVYVFGTAGEGYAVTESMFDRITAAFWKCSKEYGVRPMVGVISLSLSTIIERIERSRALGFREFQISLPSWGALNDRELDVFFAEVCNRFPDCSFLHYNLPRTKRVLGVAEYRRLTAAHPNLVAVKMGGGDATVVRELMTAVPQLLFYFTEVCYAEGRKLGHCGLLVSIASVQPRLALEYMRASEAARADMGKELATMVDALIKQSDKHGFHIDGAYDKMLFRVNNPWFPIRLLPPYQAPSDDVFNEVRAALPARWKDTP